MSTPITKGITWYASYAFTDNQSNFSDFYGFDCNVVAIGLLFRL